MFFIIVIYSITYFDQYNLPPVILYILIILCLLMSAVIG